MDSSPPASTSWAEPARIWSAASITAFSPEPHILLTVVHGTLTGTPAPTAAWRAGAWRGGVGVAEDYILSAHVEAFRLSGMFRGPQLARRDVPGGACRGGRRAGRRRPAAAGRPRNTRRTPPRSPPPGSSWS